MPFRALKLLLTVNAAIVAVDVTVSELTVIPPGAAASWLVVAVFAAPPCTTGTSSSPLSDVTAGRFGIGTTVTVIALS